MSRTNVHEPVAIANFFIEKSGSGLTLMQILKLSYIAHGFKLGLDRGELSNEYVEAWQYGPVFPSIYHEFKYEPPGNIKSLGTEIDEATPVTSNFDEKENKIMQMVHNIYGGVDGWRLSRLTHQEGTPWHTFYHKKGGNKIRGLPIDNSVIKEHFKETIIDKYKVIV